MKAVMISIQPKWCELIVNGKKTVEVRKTKPRLETPFKCYIYETKVNHGSGKVIGEFVCDFISQYESELWDDDSFERIQEFYEPDDFTEYGEYEYQTIADNSDEFWKENMLCEASCLSIEELRKYIGTGFHIFYGWHISELKIYDKPKNLNEFCSQKKCNSCKTSRYESSACMYDEECKVPAIITKAPQSWCYVEV